MDYLARETAEPSEETLVHSPVINLMYGMCAYVCVYPLCKYAVGCV
jgi:hypothetical protein